ncbi:hypothetical protein ACORG1_22955 [Mycobacterium sp. TJFP1]
MYDEAAKQRQRERKGDQPGATVADLPQLSKARDDAAVAVGAAGRTVGQAAIKCGILRI